MSDSEVQQQTPNKQNKNRAITFNQTFQSAILQKPERFLLDKTLIKGIKQNDSSKIVENGEQADLGQTTDLYNEQRQIQDIFVNTRKKYDHTKQTVVKVQNRIQKLKKQKQILDQEKTKIETNFSAEQKVCILLTSQEFRYIQDSLQKLNDMCQAADYAKFIRLQMSEVLKQDILFYKKHSFQANSKIVRNHNKVKTLQGQYQSTKKVSSNCKSLIYSIEKKITVKQSQRYQKINSYHEIINKKIQNNLKREERQKLIESSMMEALNGKMPEEQQQKKLLFVNLALKRMLKQKMERQMERFNQIQMTFRKIKQNTTVKRADEFIEKFIRRQKNYGQLLQSISKNEQKINQLKIQKQRLDKENSEIMFYKQSIQDQQNEKKILSKETNSKIDILREKLLQNQSLKNKTFSFTTKFLASFDDKNIQIIKDKLSREKPNISLKQVLQRVNNFLDSLKQQESEEKLKQIYIESRNLTLPSNVKSKNMRIKTLSTRDENQHSVLQDADIAYDDLSERDYLNQNRKQIKKSTYLRNRIKTRAY